VLGLEAAAEEGREQLMELRASHICQGDVESVLKKLGEDVIAPYGIAFLVNEEGTRCRLRAEVQEELFAIAKECMLNARNHSGSPIVAVKIRYGADHFSLEVRDQGKRSSGQRTT
jgi:signal transduction histidine kinase